MADTRTFRNYAESLQVGPSQYLVGTNERRVPRTSEGLPEGGTTGQAMVKVSDEDYDAGWSDMPDISGKADVDSPSFTGTPEAPTAAPETDTDQIATTAFVAAAISALPSGGDVTGPGGATAGNLPVLDGTGKVLSDSGTKPSDFATAAEGELAQSAVQPSDIADVLVEGDVGVLVQGFDADTAKLDVPQAWTETQRGTIVPVAPASTMTLDFNAGQEFRMSAGLDQNATLQLSNADSHVGAHFSFTGYNNGTGGFTLSYGTGLLYIGGTSAPAIPIGANKEWRVDGHIVAAGKYHFVARGVGV